MPANMATAHAAQQGPAWWRRSCLLGFLNAGTPLLMALDAGQGRAAGGEGPQHQEHSAKPVKSCGVPDVVRRALGLQVVAEGQPGSGPRR